MRNCLLLVIMALLPASAALAENTAPGEYLPPLSLTLLEKSWDTPVSRADIGRYLLFPAKTTILTAYAGQNEFLKSQKPLEDKVLDVAAGFEVDYGELDLFGPPLPEGDTFTYRALVSSLDARALRLRLDLSARSCRGHSDRTPRRRPSKRAGGSPLRKATGPCCWCARPTRLRPCSGSPMWRTFTAPSANS